VGNESETFELKIHTAEAGAEISGPDSGTVEELA